LATQGWQYTNGVFTTIDFPAEFTQPYGINDAGKIVGYGSRGGFLDTNGIFTAVPGIPHGINNSGQIVGEFARNGFLLDASGVFTIISFPGALETQPTDINNAGQIVGFYDDQIGTHGFLDTNGAFTTIDFPGAVLTSVQGINDHGQMVGYYFSLVPEPASFLLVLCGLAGLASLSKLKRI
jgi:uncharacterized membrane protein